MSKTLKILSRPKGNAEEYGKWSVNPYIGCSNGCLYCYLKKGPSAAYLGQDKPVLKKGVVNEEHAYHLAMAEIIANRDEIIRDGGLFMTFTSDPCMKDTGGLFFAITSQCVHLNIPVTMLTKCNEFVDYMMGLMCDAAADDFGSGNESEIRLAIGWTLTGHDDLEPMAVPNSKRIEEMKLVSKYKIFGKIVPWASIEPVIDFPHSLDMIYQALNAGCQHFKIGLLTNNTRVVRKDFQFGEHHFDAYKVKDCLHFIEDVMRMTDGKATVYWKQSVRDLLGTDLEAKIDEYPHSVGKGWSMFTSDVR